MNTMTAAEALKRLSEINIKRKPTIVIHQLLPASDIVRIKAGFADGGETQVDIPGVWFLRNNLNPGKANYFDVFEKYMAEQTDDSGEKPTCSWYGHDWKKYEGFSEIYHYCTKCDEKDHEKWKTEKK